MITSEDLRQELVNAYAYNSLSLNDFRQLLSKYVIYRDEEIKQQILCL